MKNHKKDKVMKKHLLALLATTAIIGAAPAAFAVDANVKSDYSSKANGGYKTTTETSHTSTNGTDTSAKKSVDVDVDDDGTTTRTIKSESSADPEGLMNGKKTSSEFTAKKKADGTYERKAEDKHTNAEGTDTSKTTKTKSHVDADGNVITKTKVEKKTDPKGLFNSNTSTSEITTKNGKVIKQETDK
jgi:hypothetical protein